MKRIAMAAAMGLSLCVVAVRGAAPAAATAPVADVRQEFVKSLSLRADRVIADSSHPMILWLAQGSAVRYAPKGATRVRLSLAQAAADGATVKELGTFEVYPRDLVQKPFGLSAELDGVADGAYRLVATVSEGEATLATLQQPVWLVQGLDARRANVVGRLAKIEGHEGAKASVLYPFDLARVVNTGRRGYNEQDLGINEAKQPNYLNFAEEMRKSEELLTALEGGKDPLWQAKGDVKRHYYFAEANEIMPYHVYVPSTWDGKTPLPMVFILHGNTRNPDFYFERNEQIIPKLAEKHGFMLVGVYGYHPNGGYNLNSMPGAGRGGRGGMAAAPAFGPVVAAGANGPRGGGAPTAFMNGMPPARLTELSELDTMHVYDLVTKEYPIDPKRTYLFGYSAGGNGGYYIGGKYADNWAAIAIGGAGSTLAGAFPYYDKLKTLNVPFFLYYGEKDTVQGGTAASAKALTEKGIAAEVKTYPGVDHDGGPAAGAGDAFDFFAAHPRK